MARATVDLHAPPPPKPRADRRLRRYRARRRLHAHPALRGHGHRGRRPWRPGQARRASRRPAPGRRRRPDGLPFGRVPRGADPGPVAGGPARDPVRARRQHPRGGARARAAGGAGQGPGRAGIRRRRRRGRGPRGRQARRRAGRHVGHRPGGDRDQPLLRGGDRRPPDAARGAGRAAVLDRQSDHRPRPGLRRGPAGAVLRGLCGRSRRSSRSGPWPVSQLLKAASRRRPCPR